MPVQITSPDWRDYQLIDSGNRDPPIGCNDAITGVDIGWLASFAAIECGNDGGSANLALRVGGIA